MLRYLNAGLSNTVSHYVTQEPLRKFGTLYAVDRIVLEVPFGKTWVQTEEAHIKRLCKISLTERPPTYRVTITSKEEVYCGVFLGRELHSLTEPALRAKDASGTVEVAWYNLGQLHRVDGPASVHRQNNGLVKKWYVNGRELPDFQEYFLRPDRIEAVIEYLLKNPNLCEEVTLLASANRWTSQQLLDSMEVARLL